MTTTRRILAGTTDVSVVIRIIDSTDGTPETGVVFNTSGIDLEYRRELAASVDITEATLAALTTAHADGGFLHIGNGYYRLDLPDAACASGATGVLVHGTVTGMVVIGTYIELVAYNPYDAVRLGLTALPNAAADAAGGLPISDAGGLDLDVRLDAAITSRLAPTVAGRTLDVSAAGEAGLDWANIGSPTTAQNLSATNIDVDQVVASVTGAIGSIAADGITAASLAADAITAAKVADGAIDAATFAAGAINAAAIATDAITAAKIAANAIGASELATDAVAEIADQVWDEVLSGHLVAGSTGAALDAAGTAGDPWSTALPGAYGAGTAGKLVGDNVNATISSRSSHSAADVWSAATRLLTAGTNIVLAKGTGVTGFNDLSAANVNAEVVDALNVDTYAEPGQEAPPATATLVKKLGWLYKMARNRKTQDATTLKIFADDATTVDAKATISDSGTVYDHGEIVTGP